MPRESFLIVAKPDLQEQQSAWHTNLQRERRLSDNTLDAYLRDMRQFLVFLTGHLGGAPGLADVKALRPADMRAFLAHRRQNGASARTLGRSLAGIRSFLRFLEKRGLANAAGINAMRAPRQPKSLPRPLTDNQAVAVTRSSEHLADEPWVAARNAAVLALLYGCGLRIRRRWDLCRSNLREIRHRCRSPERAARCAWFRCFRQPVRSAGIQESLPLAPGGGQAVVSRGQGRTAAAGHHTA